MPARAATAAEPFAVAAVPRQVPMKGGAVVQGPARERQQPLSLSAHRLIHHCAVDSHRGVTAVRARGQRVDHRARPPRL